jgi:hypothetical protein
LGSTAGMEDAVCVAILEWRQIGRNHDGEINRSEFAGFEIKEKEFYQTPQRQVTPKSQPGAGKSGRGLPSSGAREERRQSGGASEH